MLINLQSKQNGCVRKSKNGGEGIANSMLDGRSTRSGCDSSRRISKQIFGDTDMQRVLSSERLQSIRSMTLKNSDLSELAESSHTDQQTAELRL